MTEMDEDHGGVSRRTLFLGGAGAIVGATAIADGFQIGNASAVAVPTVELVRPEVLSSLQPQYSYLPIDAVDFFPPEEATGSYHRVSNDVDGTSVNLGGIAISASVPLPAGSLIRQIHISYQGTPTVSLVKRSLEFPATLIPYLGTTLAAGAGAKTQTIQLDGSTPALQPILVQVLYTFSLRFVINNPKTDFIYGVNIGYTPPVQSYVPSSGPVRVYDTRLAGSGGPTKLAPDEERTVFLGFVGARTAVVNLTITQTEGVGGYVAVFAADVPWPLNSSINWFGPNQNIANTVISSMDAGGSIKIRGGSQNTHVVVDRVGFLL